MCIHWVHLSRAGLTETHHVRRCTGPRAWSNTIAPLPPRKLLDQVRDVLRAKHYSYRTEQAYVGWIRRFILFHEKRHPLEMSGQEVECFFDLVGHGPERSRGGG